MATRELIIAGNWKLNHKRAEALALAQGLGAAVKPTAGVRVIVAPVFTYVGEVSAALRGSAVEVAGQDCYFAESGAFTGEVAATMLRDVGCAACIVGHSERRAMFGDSDEVVGKKARAAFDAGLTPIVCCGETLSERDGGATIGVVSRQLRAALSGFTAGEMAKVVIAYEPVWAIGTGRTATAAQAQEVHSAIRALLGELYGAEAAQSVSVLYGGSVKAENIGELAACADVDGALVGGASLVAASFLGIIEGAIAATRRGAV